jgi:RHS repeat-associated protein
MAAGAGGCDAGKEQARVSEAVAVAVAPSTLGSTTLTASGDTFVQSLISNRNRGGDTVLSIQALGKHRPLLFFEPPSIVAAVGSGTLVSARVVLTVASSGIGWGSSGRPVAIHRLLAASAEYQATWNCALDTNVNNLQADCTGSGIWNMNATSPAQQPWASPASATALIKNGQTGEVTFDVTADVAALLAGSSAGFGWLVKKVDEGQTGAVDFASRELGPGPRLVLEVQGAPPPDPPPIVTGSATVFANADTFVRRWQPNQNFGGDLGLPIHALSKSRALVGFDPAAISSALGGGLVRAELELPILETDANWGPDRALGAHRLRQAWNESAATWNCAVDANLGNLAADCAGSTAWTMWGDGVAPWLDPATDTDVVSSGEVGSLRFDVTRDVACALAGHVPFSGWLIKKELESQSGRVDLRSRESTAGPSLTLEWTNGTGVVVNPASCSAGPPSGCTPTANIDLTCNGVDEDCDGAIDDDFDMLATECGVGACHAEGEVSCIAGQVVDSCSPGSPAASDATCDGRDDDCDGAVDENFPVLVTTCGVGPCSSSGESRCVSGVVVDSCTPGTPAANDAVCNGVDDDCSGTADEDYFNFTTTCGVGACARTGTSSCAAGQVVDDCTPGSPAPDDATCNGSDDDCDGANDEDFAPACAGSALQACVAGAVQSHECSDGNVCNGVEACAAAACVPGTPLPLDDQNPCTADSCHPVSGVQHTPLAGQACTLDACSSGACDGSGVCRASTAPPPDDGNPCTLTLCDPETGVTQVNCEAIDESRVTTLFESLDWLYTGPSPIQTGVLPGTIQRHRVALVRGEVRDRSGVPLGGVDVRVAGHPEFGSTLTQTNGSFDLVVNGGGQLTIEFDEPSRLRAQRSVETVWDDIVRVPTVVLIEPDPVVTEIDLSQTAEPFQVATGSVQVDEDGPRQATLLFPAGTQAVMYDADGTATPLDTLNVRATEFTVGASGPDAMPGPLPFNSGYTYAVEFNADEAVESGAHSIQFSEPLIGYVDNFLEFPAGTVVPVGAFDADERRWVPHKSGIVLNIVSTGPEGAFVDVTGDGLADTATVLQAHGIAPEELVQLAALRQPGDSVWRIEVPHFTQPYDCNWPFGPPPDAGSPPGPDPDGDDDPNDPDDDPDEPEGPEASGPETDDPCRRSGSIIECQTMTLRESVPVSGTPYSLEYASNRVPGRRDTLRIPIRITRDQVPASLLRVLLEIDIAGRHFSESFGTAPDQYYVFNWDGLDRYGRAPKGQQTAKVKLSYVYRGSYQTAGKFGNYGSGVAISGIKTRQEIFLTREWQEKLGAWEVPGFGGWSLDVHHQYDANSGAIYLGDGRRTLANQSPTVFTRVASPPTGESVLGNLRAVAPDGTMYFTIDIHWLRRRSPDGTLTYLLQNPPVDELVLAPDGTLYLLEFLRHRIQRFDPRTGALTHVAGTGVAGFSGDGGPATLAQLNDPKAMAVDAAGSLYIADTFNRRIRRIGPDGIITTIAGNGKGLASDEKDNVLATESALMFPTNVAVALDGTVYVADRNNHRLYEVAPNGIINRRIASPSPGSQGPVYVDGLPGRNARVFNVTNLAVSPSGEPYFTANMYWQPQNFDAGIFVLGKDKRVYRVAGGSRLEAVFQSYYTGAPPRGIFMTNPANFELELGPQGLYVGAGGFVDRLAVPPPTLSNVLATDMLVASDENAEVYVFDGAGRHKDTRHAGTGAVMHRFTYDARGLLSTIVDSDGNQTLIERDTNGAPLAIQSPYGQRTLLSLDEHGHLSEVTDPLGSSISLTTSPDGLLQSLTDARGGITSMQYDSLGRLTSQLRPNQGQQQLLAFGNRSSWRLDFVTAEGRTTRYRQDQTPEGEIFTSTFADQTTATSRYDQNAARWVTTAKDGTVSAVRESSDPRFGFTRAIRETTLTLPSGLSYKVETTRAVTGSQIAQDPFNYLSENLTFRVNGNAWSEAYSPGTRTRSLSSPEGRQVTVREDEIGRVTQQVLTGQQAVNYAYDADGRLETITQGSRVTRLAYTNAGGPTDGYLESVTNALGERVLYDRDARGRSVIERYADNAQMSIGWDANDNMLSLTPPGKPAHTQTYTAMDEVETSTPPLLPGIPEPQTTFAYDLDGNITREERPDGTVRTMAYDSAGRPELLTLPTGTIAYAYYPNTNCPGCAPGSLMSVTGPGAIAFDIEYDGQLVLATNWSGAVDGSLRFAHDNNFRIIRETASGAGADQTFHYGYDRDGLQTCASPTNCTSPGADALRFTYNQASQPATSTLGSLSTSYTYNTFGEPATANATYASAPLLSLTYDNTAGPRDAIGRIRSKTETAQGVTTSWVYGYDTRGRLTTVTKNGTLAATYGYDENGNRTTRTTPAGTVVAVHDDQDRLMSLGALAFSYQESGELESKLDTGSGALTSYVYDALGNLLSVTLPDERQIRYQVDGRGRRVGKQVDGAQLRGFLYRDQLRIAAELDGTGQIVSQFVYIGTNHSPDALRRGGVTYRLLKDQLGSVRLVVNVTTGQVVQALEYDEFGVVLTDTNPGFQPFGFAGGIYDGDTGLVRFGSRDYDPLTGRWTAKDPSGPSGGVNLYAYVGNNPVSETDPTGECPWCIAAGVGAVSGAGFDLALQLLMNGGNLGCVNWDSVLFSGLAGAALSGLGPSGFLIGRGGPKAAPFGYSRTRALLNRGNTRFGWSGPKNGKDYLSLRVGKKHYDVPGTGVPSGGNPARDGAASGLLGGGLGRATNPACDCN